MSEGSVDRDVSLIDIFVVLAESWALLVLGPLCAAALVFAVLTFTETHTYEAVSLLTIDASEAGLLQSAPLLEEALSKSSWGDDKDIPIAEIRRDFQSENLRVRRDDRAGFYSITITADDPDGAFEISQHMIEALIRRSVPSGQVRNRILADIARAENSIDILEKSLARLVATGTTGTPGQDLDAAIVAIVSSLDERRQVLEKRTWELQGSVSVDDVVQVPTLTTLPTKSKLAGAAAAGVGVGVVLVIFAFIRDAFRSSSTDPRRLPQINRIRKAFRLRPLEMPGTPN